MAAALVAPAAEPADSRAVFRRDGGELAALLQPVASAADVAATLGRLEGTHDGQTFLPCLEVALEACGLTNEVGAVFAAIFRWALAALAEAEPESFPQRVAVWPPGGPREVKYTAAQCRGLLANATLLNVRDTCPELKPASQGGGLNWSRMLASKRPVAAHKVACLISYFQAMRKSEGTEDDLREVVWERRASEADGGKGDEGDGAKAALYAFRAWVEEHGVATTCDPTTCDVTLHDGGMEGVHDADAFVNFANPIFGYGHFIASCTQEEVIQVCCPEFNVGMLHQGHMGNSEVVATHGVRRFCRYAGYLDTFTYRGPWTGLPEVQTILTMDATTQQHFSEVMNLRDIQKAYLSFKGCRVVSTGRWGCGAFGGMPAHKFAQQVVAASLAGCSLRFSTFGTPDLCDEVLKVLAETKPTAIGLLHALTLAGKARRRDAAGFVHELAGLLRGGGLSRGLPSTCTCT